MRAHTKVYTQHSSIPMTTTSKAHTAISLLLLVALSACTTVAAPPATTTPTPAPTPSATTFPLQMEGIMPNTGSEFQPVALSPIQAAINALNYGVVYADGNVGKIANQTCISVVPEKIGNASGAAESLVSKDLTNGVAKYSGGMQVLAEVPVPPNTDTDTYTCAMTYDKSNSVLYQTLVHTDVVTGDVEVLAAIPAAYSKSDKLEIINNTVKVNGETVNWTYLPGKEAPTPAQNWSLEIPDSPDKCTNVIRNDTFENTTVDITALNKKIIESRPAGEVFPKMILTGVSSDFMPHTVIAFDFIDIISYPPNGETAYDKLLSCSNYGDGIVYGAYLPVGTGDQQTLIPVQVFFDRAVLKQIFESQGKTDPRYDIMALTNSKEGNVGQISWRLYGHFANTTDQYKNSLTGLYGQYLDEKYDYSNRLELLMNHYGEDPKRDTETIALFQTIMLPGTAIPITDNAGN